MSSFLHNSLNQLPNHRVKTALIFATIAFTLTFIVEYFFIREFLPSLWLAAGTSLCAFLLIIAYHFIIFGNFLSQKWKIILLYAFPLFYLGFLICAFGFVTMSIGITWFQVPILNQIYLQMWAFLGKAFIYAAFSPKTPYVITSFLVVFCFHAALKYRHAQANKD